MMLCFRSYLHSNEIGTHLSMLTMGESPPLQVKFGSRRSADGEEWRGGPLWSLSGDSVARLPARPFTPLVTRSCVTQLPPLTLAGMSRIQAA